MLEAVSMFFGGEVISASECNYQSSRELGLKCPFCSSAVFIRSESVRQTKGKLQLVRPYFAHYPSGAPDNWDCEKRSHTKQGRGEIEKLKIQARNQRLRAYNAHLWQMIANSHGIKNQHLNKIRSLFGESWCERTSILVRHEWKLALSDVYTFIDAAVQDVAKMAEKEHFLLACDRRFHLAIAQEVADFLATDTGGFAFLKLFKLGVGQQLNLAPHWGVREIKKLSPIAHISSLAVIIASTHWAEQINLRSQGRVEIGTLRFH